MTIDRRAILAATPALAVAALPSQATAAERAIPNVETARWYLYYIFAMGGNVMRVLAMSVGAYYDDFYTVADLAIDGETHNLMVPSKPDPDWYNPRERHIRDPMPLRDYRILSDAETLAAARFVYAHPQGRKWVPREPRTS